jgi:hypothetical protein
MKTFMKTTKALFGILTITCGLAACGYSQSFLTNYFSTAIPNEWKVAGGGATNATPYVFNNPSLGALLSITSTGWSNGTYVVGMTNFTGFWLADYVFYLAYGATNISLSYSDFYVDDRGLLLLNGNPIVASGIPYNGNYNPGSLVYTDGGSPQPYSSFVGPYGSVSGTVTSGFNTGGFNTLRVIVNNTYQGVFGPDFPLLGSDGTAVRLSGAVSYTLTPVVNLIKAVKPSFNNLTLTTNYQLQLSADMLTWTNQGSAFTATNTSMVYPQYWDVDNWNSLFFRLQVTP